MNKILLILYVLVTSFIVFAQSDSLNTQKWKSQHSVGVELGGRLMFYSLYYEFGVKKNKIEVGLSFHSNVVGFIQKSNSFGNGLALNFNYGTKHIFLASLLSGALFNPAVIRGGYESNNLTDPYQITPKIIFDNSLSIGYGYNFSKTPLTFHANASIHRLNYTAENNIVKNYKISYYYPLVGVGIKYRFKKQ